jgi:hypothetical protein
MPKITIVEKNLDGNPRKIAQALEHAMDIHREVFTLQVDPSNFGAPTILALVEEDNRDNYLLLTNSSSLLITGVK